MSVASSHKFAGFRELRPAIVVAEFPTPPRPMLARAASRLRLPLSVAGGLTGAALIDRQLLTPHLKAPLVTAAAAKKIGSVHIYQYEICPFCNKVKALLDLQRLPYETTEVNPLTKGETKAWSGGYRKVPIALLEGEQVNDSAVICEGLLDKMGASGAMGAAELAAFRSPEALEWAKWSDEKFAVLLFPNITRSFSEAYEAFGYVMEVPHFSTVDKWSNQLVGAFAMWMAQGKIKKKYAIDDERAAVRAGLRHWLDEGVGTRPFAGGDRPHFGDVAVFGCLKAIDRTAAYQELLEEPAARAWYDRMAAEVRPGNACMLRQ